MSKTNKKNNSTTSVEEARKLQQESKQELQQLIIHLTEQKTQDRFSDKYLDRENEKIKLLGGAEISIGEIKAFVTAQRQPWEAKFPNDVPFFKEIFRLNKWDNLNPNKYIKPPIVGTWINEIIYGRYSKDVLPAIQVLNPYIAYGIKLHKNFQYLTEEGQLQLEGFRDDAIRIMKTCETWYEFRVKLFNEFRIPYQKSLFENN